MYRWEPRPFEASETSFQVPEYIQQMVRADPHNVQAIVELPEDQDEKVPRSRPFPALPASPRVQVWVLEQIRQTVLQLNSLAVAMVGHNTLPEMTVGEQKYLGAPAGPRPRRAVRSQNLEDGVFTPPRDVDAMTYIWHTLDWAGNQCAPVLPPRTPRRSPPRARLQSEKNFPSRLTVDDKAARCGDGRRRRRRGALTRAVQVKVFSTVMRRVYRILAHAHCHFRCRPPRLPGGAPSGLTRPGPSLTSLRLKPHCVRGSTSWRPGLS